MRTTHVVRGEEWLSSLPIHIELFNVLGFKEPVYCHTAQLMKIDEEGNKRKLSKRLDPELVFGSKVMPSGIKSKRLSSFLVSGGLTTIIGDLETVGVVIIELMFVGVIHPSKPFSLPVFRSIRIRLKFLPV